MRVMDVLRKHFLDGLSKEGFPEKVIIGWSFALRDFVNWCDEREITSPDQFTHTLLDQYQDHLYHYRNKHGFPLIGSIIQRRMIAALVFYHWLFSEGYILDGIIRSFGGER